MKVGKIAIKHFLLAIANIKTPKLEKIKEPQMKKF